MAIDFPNTPVNGTTYAFLGTVYTWTDTGGSTGYWKVMSTGSTQQASVPEIDAGVESVKYVTPLGLETSKYLDTANTIAVNKGGTGAVTKTGSGANVLGTSPSISNASLTGNPTATTQAVGDDSTRLATTAFVKDMSTATTSQFGSSKDAITGIITNWGYSTGASGSRAISFHQNYATACYNVQITHRNSVIAGFTENILVVGTPSTTGFTAYPAGAWEFFWVAIGK